MIRNGDRSPGEVGPTLYWIGRLWVAPLLGFALVAPATVPGALERAGTPSGPTVGVIVQVDGDLDVVRRAVVDAGGTVGVPLPIIAGFAATLPRSALASLHAHHDVAAITPDDPVHVMGAADDGPAPLTSVVADAVGVRALHERGVTGEGVTVALVDTGVSPVADIVDRLVEVADPADPSVTSACVNFSGEATCDDTYGHGTFLAGLVAGNGAASNGAFIGMAPGASIVSVKIAGRDGSTDVSKVLAAIQWVVSFRDEHDIRVLNLSLGTDSTADYRRDPLNLAVQRAWDAGITVVVAASNRGPAARTISKPADDPLVITVGAVDDQATVPITDDRLPRFTGRGPTAHNLPKPDVVAPGARVVSLVAPGSRVEELVPAPQPDYRRGSGTSMSAAVVSGVAALLHDARPSWAPGHVKRSLVATARPVASSNRNAVGAGLVDADSASRLQSPIDANRDVDRRRDGTGELDSARGRMRVTRPCDDSAQRTCPLGGNVTALGRAWDAAAFANDPWTGSSWYESQWSRVATAGSSWHGSSWYGSSWYGTDWSSGTWSGSSWYGETDDSTDYGTSIHGSSWYGAWS